MTIVLDANLLVALVTPHPLRARVYEWVEHWLRNQETLHAPCLAHYEVNSALTKLIGAEQFSQEKSTDICRELAQIPVVYHPSAFDQNVIKIALSLQRKSAYDAVYLTLARVLNADLWTLDGPLYRNASVQGFPINLLN
jgi:predicted nucleic acid-binding protein